MIKNRFDEDKWNLVDRDVESQNYGINYRFDFSNISSEEIKVVLKDYTHHYYISGNKTLSSLYIEVNCCFAKVCDFMNIYGMTSLREFDNSKVDTFISYLHTVISDSSKKPLSYKYQKHCLDFLKSVIKWCQAYRPNDAPVKEIFTGNEYRGVNERLKIDFIPDYVVAQINDAIKTEENPYLKCGLIIMQTTGMRLGDLLSLRIDCIKQHPISGYTINWIQNKTRKSISMPARQECVDAIKHIIAITADIREEADEVYKDVLMIWRSHHSRYSGNIRPISNYTFSQSWLKGFVKRNDIRGENGELFNLTSRHFRRTLGTDMLSKGTDINVIQQVLGHSDPYVTKKFYADVKDKERGKVYEAIGIIGNVNQLDVSVFDNVSEYEWFKENKYKAACLCDGYCTKPIVDGKICERILNRQKCYTCSRYITTPEYLEAHKLHLANLEKEVVEGAIYGKHYVDHLRPTIEVLKFIIERLEGLEQ